MNRRRNRDQGIKAKLETCLQTPAIFCARSVEKQIRPVQFDRKKSAGGCTAFCHERKSPVGKQRGPTERDIVNEARPRAPIVIAIVIDDSDERPLLLLCHIILVVILA